VSYSLVVFYHLLPYKTSASSIVINISSPLVSGKFVQRTPANKLITPKTAPGNHGTSSCKPNKNGVKIPPILAPRPATPIALPLIGVGKSSNVQIQVTAKLPAINNLPMNAKVKFAIINGWVKYSSPSLDLVIHLVLAISMVKVDNKQAIPPVINMNELLFLRPNLDSRILGWTTYKGNSIMNMMNMLVKTVPGSSAEFVESP